MDPHELHERVRRLELKAARLVTGTLAGAYRSAFRGQGLELDRIRPYTPGDDPRRIAWSASARGRGLQVKVHREARELNVFAVLDRSASMAAGPANSPTKAEVSLELAALFGLLALRNRDRFGLLTAGSELEALYRPSAGRAHLLVALEEAAYRAASAPGTALSEALHATAQTLSRRAVVVVLSDFLAADWAQPAIRLAGRHDVLLLRLYHPKEFQRLPTGLPVQSAEGHGKTPQVATRRISRAVVQQLTAATTALDDVRRKTGAGVLHLDVTQDYFPPLQQLLLQRKGR